MNDMERPNGKPAAGRPLLRVIAGGRTRCLYYDGGLIVVAPADTPPFVVDARVVEEDTFRIMSAAPEWAPPEVHPLQLMNELQHYESDRPGSVVVQAGRPIRLLAVVYDLDCDPSWRVEWVAAALRQIMREAAKRRLYSLGLPLLGRQHGRMPRAAFVDLLAGVLADRRSHVPRRLWLMVSAPVDVIPVFRALRDRLFSPRHPRGDI